MGYFGSNKFRTIDGSQERDFILERSLWGTRSVYTHIGRVQAQEMRVRQGDCGASPLDSLFRQLQSRCWGQSHLREEAPRYLKK